MNSPAIKLREFELSAPPSGRPARLSERPPANSLLKSGDVEAEPKDVVNSVAAAHKSKLAGRPRSEKSRQSILVAAYELLMTINARELTIEAVAKHAGVGKTTIYRWWANKVALILDAVTEHMNAAPAAIDLSQPEESLVRQMERFAKICLGHNGRIMAGVLAESQGSAEMKLLFEEKFMAHHREILSSILGAGVASGAFPSALDIPMSCNMIYGSLFFHLMTVGDDLNREFVDQWIVNALKIMHV